MYAQSQKIENQIIQKAFENKYTKGPKQGNQYRLNARGRRSLLVFE